MEESFPMNSRQLLSGKMTRQFQFRQSCGISPNARQTEKALQEAEEKFRNLFNGASDAIFIHDLKGHFLEVNEIACKRLGYSREELLRMTAIDIDTEEYAPLVAERIKQILTKES